jgi:hypothetical protein
VPSGGFALKRNPGTGHLHDVNICPSFRLELLTQTLDETASCPAIVEQDGVVKVRLDHTLRLGQIPRAEGVSGDKSGTAHQAGPGGTTRHATTLLGLLQFMWGEARLNIWHPGMEGKRDWNLVSYLISQQAKRIEVAGTQLGERFVALCKTPKESWSEAASRIGLQIKATHAAGFKALLLAGVTEVRQCPKTWRICTPGFRDIYLLMDGPTHDSFVRAHGTGLGMLERDPSVRGVALVEIGPPSGDSQFYPVTRAALMPVTRRFIPVASSYEQEVADALAAEHRTFVKPLDVDATLRMCPDFMLTDTAREYALEVFGMVSIPAYAKHMQDKIALYQQQNVALWSWIPEQHSRPPFPPPRRPWKG